jgi:hypothetical protein
MTTIELRYPRVDVKTDMYITITILMNNATGPLLWSISTTSKYAKSNKHQASNHYH